MNNKNKSFLLFSFSLLMPIVLSAQFVSGFESQPIDSSLGFNAGSENSPGFTDNGLLFRNDYNASFQSWNGFALSRKTDSLTAGYENQFSCRPGFAYEGNTFALAYASGRIFFRRHQGEPERRLKSFHLANSTYAARSMQNGDSFAKKFGGPDGLDPDFFMLKVFNYLNGSISDSASFYLADYRSEGTQNDFILTNWRLAETQFTQSFDSIGFELSSSDVGSFGMNTPAYFCIDQVVTESLAGIKGLNESGIALFPNPAHENLYIKSRVSEKYSIIDNIGRLVSQGKSVPGIHRIDIRFLPSGMYVLHTGSFANRFLVR